ncbi:MAG: hypothetical protein O9267_05305 [Flavobacterium sp.]|uniref:hypothetical protein n=1 Tax=Flavobacterium sp. TaxID=239 RepID=UPI0022BDB661|nr:hypothetical protein [Flavobacterium sp.]MCZ8197001.1 hypothetical protein [Flavobacterium sp.]
MKKIFLIFILTVLQSCNEKSQDKIREMTNQYSFNADISNSNKILIRHKKNNQTESSRNDTCFDNINTLKAEKSKQINAFKTLFENSEFIDYYCCPKTNYCIDFYKGSNKINTYFADTIEYKNKIRIFEKSYQFSYLVEKEKWKSFLNKIKNEK